MIEGLVVTGKRGRYGLNKIYRVAGHAVGYRIRTEHQDRIYAGRPGKGFLLFSWRLPAHLVALARRNEEYESRNRTVVEGLPQDKPCVLYVMDCLFTTGGVERRLELQFEWLLSRGIQPILVVGTQGYAPLESYPCLHLLQQAPNACRMLMEFVRLIKPIAVEFNVKSTDLLQVVDIEALRMLTRVGVMIHNTIKVDQGRLDALDYRVSVRKHEMPYSNLTFIPNVVRFPDVMPVYRLDAGKALYIGRIDREKLPTVKNFVTICRRYGLEYEIAGPVYKEEAVSEWIQGQPKDVMLGTLDTRAWLAEHGAEYAFIGGVGQVVLEAVAANLPCLVATHGNNALRSAFVTKGNLASLLEWNCVLRGCPEATVSGNVVEFFEARARSREDPQGLEQFRVRKELVTLRSEENIWEQYLEILRG